MGAVLRCSAFSPNIKDRLDYSCAIFNGSGELCSQAAHIPVHLGSMAYAMQDVVKHVDWHPGDMLILNDPYLGGTHLPDVTLIAPLFSEQGLCGFIANRAHHADIGCDTPGSMPLAHRLEDEGIVIPPTHLLREGQIDAQFFQSLLDRMRNPVLSRGDLSAQISANLCGLKRLSSLLSSMTVEKYQAALQALNDYAEQLARNSLSEIPEGHYEFTDVMDDDGDGNTLIPIRVSMHITDTGIHLDFSGTAQQTSGNVNCPISVTAAAVYYVFHCLMPAHTPACAGSFRPITIHAPSATLLNASYPAAVAAGNVETSTRIVDVVLGALAAAIPERIPAASHGSMNNIAMGADDWDYYETIGGGMGAGQHGGGLDAVQTHMTNTLNTPIEVVEMNFPLRIRRYQIRQNSGGAGLTKGGNGLIREYEFLRDTSVTVLSERRSQRPWGLAGGLPGEAAATLINGKHSPAKFSNTLHTGERLTILTAGGGGWGKIEPDLL